TADRQTVRLGPAGREEHILWLHPQRPRHRVTRADDQTLRRQPLPVQRRRVSVVHGQGARHRFHYYGMRSRGGGVVQINLHNTSILARPSRSEEHTSELQSLAYLVCRLLLEKK